MIELSPLSRNISSSDSTLRGDGRRSRALRPPRGFSPFKGSGFTDARFGAHIPPSHGRTAAQKAGLRYERRVHDVLGAIYGDAYVESPGILYRDGSGLRRAIPDGILTLPNYVLVVEIKIRHCERAWWQLERMYRPLVVRILGGDVRICELCASYDPDVIVPGPSRVVDSLHRVPQNIMGVLPWKL